MIYTIGWCVCCWIARGFFGLQVEGVEHVPDRGPVILAPNHVSYLDPMLVGASIRRRAHFMAKKELFKNPVAAWILRSVQAYPVTRERLDPSTLKHALSLLKGGEVLLIFPEGTRGMDGRLAPRSPVWPPSRLAPRLRWCRYSTGGPNERSLGRAAAFAGCPCGSGSVRRSSLRGTGRPAVKRWSCLAGGSWTRSRRSARRSSRRLLIFIEAAWSPPKSRSSRSAWRGRDGGLNSRPRAARSRFV